MSVKYIATKTIALAGRGYEPRTYQLVEGEEVSKELLACEPTLLDALKSNLVRKETTGQTDAPETKKTVTQKVKSTFGLGK